MPSNTIVAKGQVIADAGVNISGGTGLSWEDGHVSVASNDGTDVEMRTNYVARMKIISNGNIGINTIDPQTTLDVHGTISATALKVNGVAITGGGGSGSRKSRVLKTVSGTIAVPSWATYAEVFALGGGGCGDNLNGTGTGGLPGKLNFTYWSFPAGSISTMDVTVGSAGADGNGAWNSGVSGGSTTISSTLGTVVGAGGNGNGGTLNVITSATSFPIPNIYGAGGTGWPSYNTGGYYGATQGAAMVDFYDMVP
jgi:hypothetical protein